MNQEFVLNISDTRLLQTWHLLNRWMTDHPDQDAVAEALIAISAARNHIAKLRP